MSTPQIAIIQPALARLAQAEETKEPDYEHLCATFTVPEYPTIWLQVQPGAMNAAYPSEEEPLFFLRLAAIDLLPGLAVEHWQPRRFATLSHAPCPIPKVADFIDQWLASLHQLEPNYPVAVQFEHLT